MRWLSALGLLLAGCGSPVDLLSGGRVEGDADAVSVQAESAPQAAPMALAHCSHYDRGAQFDRQLKPGVYRYLCVSTERV
jgi:hypothetical protein